MRCCYVCGRQTLRRLIVEPPGHCAVRLADGRTCAAQATPAFQTNGRLLCRRTLAITVRTPVRCIVGVRLVMIVGSVVALIPVLAIVGLVAYVCVGLFVSVDTPGRIALGLVAWFVLSLPVGMFVAHVIAVSRRDKVRADRSSRGPSRKAA